MEAALLSAFLEPVVSNLVPEVMERARKFKDRSRAVLGYKDDIDKLSSYLQSLNRVLEDAMPFYRRFENSPYEQNAAYKKLVRAMYRIAEDAEDVIDDCEYKKNLCHGLLFCQFVGGLWQSVLLPFTVSRRIGAIRSQIEGLKSVTLPENPTASIPGPFLSRTRELRRRSSKLAIMRRNSIPRFQAVEARPIGFDEYITKVEGLISDNETDIFGIHGMAGSGKSLLMKYVWNKVVLKSFDLPIWVFVPGGQLSRFRQTISGLIGINFDEDCNENEAKDQIYRHLLGKRFLMVLDGVWHNQGEGFLSDLGIPSDDMVSGSKIVVISSDRNDLSRIRPDMHLVSIEPLSEKNSCKLFNSYAFGSRRPHDVGPDVLEAAREMAKQCHGHPLSLKAYGAAMAGKTQPWQWQVVSKARDYRSFGNYGDAERRVLECLSSTYASLPPPLRLAFLYLAAFPESHAVKTSDLFDMWTAEKLIRAQSPSELQNSGLNLIDLMIDRCLVEDIETGSLGRVRKCKMHPMFRLLALHLLQRESDDDQMQLLQRENEYNSQKSLFQAGDNIKSFPSKDVHQHRRISLMYSSIICLPQTFECKGLRTLILRHCKDLSEIPPGFLKGLSWLKTLDLTMTGIQSLPKALGYLERLEYLNLSGTQLKSLPMVLNRLYRLKKLNLFECKQLECLPFEMNNLENLHYLNLRRCEKLKFLPYQVTQIVSLQCLIMDGCNSLQWEEEDLNHTSLPKHTVHRSRLEDLKSLKELKYLSIVCNTSRIPQDLMGSFRLIERLEICKLQSQCLREYVPAMDNLKDLRLSSLERLVQLPSWIGGLSFLIRMTLEHLPVKALPSGIFETLSLLRLLEIEHCNELTELPSEFGKQGAFPKLEELRLDNLEALKELPALEEGSMSCLKELRVRYCPAITQFPRGVENLKKVTRIDIVNSSGLIQSVSHNGVDNKRMKHLLSTLTGII